MARKTGSYERLRDIEYFIPNPLPPKDPPVELTNEITIRYGEAMHELGRLNEIGRRLPDIRRFIKAYVIKEALLSSEIEGIYTTLVDVFTTSILESRPDKQTQLVLNYTFALNAALDWVQSQGMPVASRVLLNAHEILMSDGDGDRANPGAYRKQSVRVGNLIPPMASRIPDLMGELERYINTEDSLSPLIKAGLAHVQFETIHPFLDGNGRIGRLLMVLMLINSGLLSAPILYPSHYFRKNQLEYYRRLDRVRTEGDFEGWISFYLEAIKMSSIDAHKRIKEIEALEETLCQAILSGNYSSRGKDSCLKALSILFRMPIINVKELSHRMGNAYNTAKNILLHFIELGVLEETGEQKRNKRFRFKSYLDLLEKD